MRKPIYKFIDDKGTFIVKDPQKYNLYFPLCNSGGTLLSSISPNLAGDIKKDNEHFLTPPASIEDIRSNILCRRDFFLKINGQIIRLSNPNNDILEAGFLYQKIIKETTSLQIEITNFIPYNLGVEVMWVKVKNKSKNKLKMIPTSFIPLYGRPEKNLRDHRHVTSLLNRIELDKFGIFLKPTMVFDEKGHSRNKAIYFVLGLEEKAIPPIGQFPTFDYFCGGSDLLFPDAIGKNIKPVVKKNSDFEGKEVCAAFRFRQKELKEAEEVNYFLIMGIDDDKKKIKNTFVKLDSPDKVKQSFEETKKYWRDHLACLEFDFKERNFNNWLLWIRMQPTLRKLFGCSFLPHFDYGKGGRGWRDLWQDALTLLFTEPDKAKRFILNSFKGVRIDGSNATIITRDGEFISDRNRINRIWMDHGIWPYLTLRQYIDKTGDLNILFKDIAYFRDAQLKRSGEIVLNFNQKDHLLRTRKNEIYQGSLLEHILVQNLVQFFNVGRHNIIRLENADWNDGLDMAVEDGESAALSFMYAHNLLDLCSVLRKLRERTESITIFKELVLLLDRLNSSVNYLRYREKQKRLDKYFKNSENLSGEKIKIKIDDLVSDLKDKSESLFSWLRRREWINQLGFFNGYYDNQAKRVEGKFNGKIRMMLSSQVFPMMSFGATEKQIGKAWISIKRYLKDKNLDGFRLNTNFDDVYLSLGRAFGFSYGDKENGAFFNHMVVMLANALYKRGFVKEGFEVMDSIYKMATDEKAKIYPSIPEYFNNEGRGLYLYLTGSASWYVYTLLEEVLGIKFIWGDILFEPKLFKNNFLNHNIELKIALGRKLVKIIFATTRKSKSQRLYRIKDAFLEKQRILPRNGRYIVKVSDLTKIKAKEVTITICLE